MSNNDEQHAAETHITRREAMEKIGRLGIYVPATLAVLSAAPRAFAQSATGVSVSGTVLCDNEPVAGFSLALRLGAAANSPVDSTTTDDNGNFSLSATTAGTGTWYLTPSASIEVLKSGPYPGDYTGVIVEVFNCVN